MNDIERIEEIQKAVAIFYERGESEKAHEFLNKAADYSRRFERQYGGEI